MYQRERTSQPRPLHSDSASTLSARYDRALHAWQAGEYEQSLLLLDDIPFDRHTSDSILLRARSLIRVNRLSEAKSWLTLNAPRHQLVDAVATNAMLMGSACAQLSEHAQAEQWFDVARSASCHHTIAAECNYLRAMSRYLVGDFEGARRIGKLALHPDEDIVYARMRSLFGWIAIAQFDYAYAYVEFLASLDVLDRCHAKDTHLRASIVCALAITAAEAQIGEAEMLDAETAKVRWTADLVKQQVQTLRHTGFMYESRGDGTNAMRRYAAAADVAPGTVWAIYGYVDCANLAFRLGQLEAADAFAFMARRVDDRLVETVGWQAVTGEHRISLLELAQVFARLGDSAYAGRCRNLYYEDTSLEALSSLNLDVRLANYKLHVDAVVDASIGKRLEATASLQEVRQQWIRIGFSRRAAEAMDDLALLDRGVPAVTNASSQPGFSPPLSRRDNAIVELIAAGLSNAEIGEALDIAPKTVKNRIGQIYKQYGVHDRTKLALRSKLQQQQHVRALCEATDRPQSVHAGHWERMKQRSG